MKKIILVFFITFFINSASAKIEKTTFGIDMDIPNDYVLVKKENYEQLKKIVEFSTQPQSQILKPSRENNKSDVDVLITSGTRDKSYLIIIPFLILIGLIYHVYYVLFPISTRSSTSTIR